MKLIPLALASLLAACSFEPGGVAYEGPDAGDDADAATVQDGASVADGGADVMTDADPGTPAATIACTTETVDGYPKIVLTFGGDVLTGFLGDDPGVVPAVIEYGSNEEDSAVRNSCGDTWAVPYPVGCTKNSPVWGAEVKLYVEPEVDFLNVALRYGDGTVRWGDLKTSDGDSVGFDVSGSGTAGNIAFDCRIELTGGGAGGYIRTHL